MTKQKTKDSKQPAFWSKARSALIAADPALGEIIKRCGSGRLQPRNDAFFSLARSIVGQQISVKAAESIWNKLETALGEVTAQTISRRSPEQIRKFGVTRQKSTYLLDLAHHFSAGGLDQKNWTQLSDSEVIEHITKIKGIGPWTAEMFLIFHLLRPDVLPLGDIGIQNAMKLHFNGGTRMTPGEMSARAAPWRPWRSVASWYLWRSLDPLPVDY